LLGVVGLIARMSAGYLLDKLPANLVATAIFLLPVAGCGLLLLAEPSYLVLVIAVASFGATIGAEYDVVFYMTSRHFGLKSFGALLGVILTFGSMAGALGPLTAGWLHDRFGNYDGLLVVLMTMMALSALAMATLGAPKQRWEPTASGVD
jgi:nitrate/nitrite transporter NarK